MISKLKFLLAPTLLLLPMLVLGAGGATGNATRGLLDVITQISELVATAIPIVIGLGLLLFLWGVLRHLLTKDEIQKEEARKFMLWGIIALFVMTAVWGFVNILKSTLLGGDAGTIAPTAPRVPGLK